MVLFRTSGGMMGLLLLAGLATRAQELVRVSRVVDADTYEIIHQSRRERVRLLHVDAPETGQPFGLAATDSVRALLATAPLIELTTYGADLYGRTLGAVRVGLAPTGRLGPLDSVLVARGWAWAYAPPGRQRVKWAQEQLRAQAYGRGLWKCGTTEPVPPRIWRSFNYRIKRRYQGGCTW